MRTSMHIIVYKCACVRTSVHVILHKCVQIHVDTCIQEYIIWHCITYDAKTPKLKYLLSFQVFEQDFRRIHTPEGIRSDWSPGNHHEDQGRPHPRLGCSAPLKGTGESTWG